MTYLNHGERKTGRIRYSIRFSFFVCVCVCVCCCSSYVKQRKKNLFHLKTTVTDIYRERRKRKKRGPCP